MAVTPFDQSAENHMLHLPELLPIKVFVNIAGIGILYHFCSCDLDLDLDTLTFIYELDPYPIKT